MESLGLIAAALALLAFALLLSMPTYAYAYMKHTLRRCDCAERDVERQALGVAAGCWSLRSGEHHDHHEASCVRLVVTRVNRPDMQ
jgi:hypothetical protein